MTSDRTRPFIILLLAPPTPPSSKHEEKRMVEKKGDRTLMLRKPLRLGMIGGWLVGGLEVWKCERGERVDFPFEEGGGEGQR